MIPFFVAPARALPDLGALEARAAAADVTLATCAEAPDACDHAAVPDALYARCLHRFVHGDPPDAAAVGALAIVDPARFALLPAPVRAAAGPPPAWLTGRLVDVPVPPRRSDQPRSRPLSRVRVRVYDLGRDARAFDRALGHPMAGVLHPARGRDLHGFGVLLVQPELVAREGEPAHHGVDLGDRTWRVAVTSTQVGGSRALSVHTGNLEPSEPGSGAGRQDILTPDDEVFLRRELDGHEVLLTVAWP